MANRNTKYNRLRWSKAARKAMREREIKRANGVATQPLTFIAAYRQAREAGNQ